MSRTIPAALLAHIAGEALTLALMVRVERTDSIVLGFTSHDRDLSFASETYLATSAIEASAIRNTLGRQLDTLDVIGLLQSSVIADSDLIAGLYDGARVETFLVNWTDSPITERIGPLHSGTIGEVSLTDGQWVAEFRPLSARLAHQIGQLTSPTCRVKEWGDSECAPGGLLGVSPGVAISTYRHTGRVVSVVTSAYQMTFATSAEASDYFSYGRVAMTTGNNAGLSREVKRHTLSGGSAVIELQEPFPRAVAVSDVAMLEAGCNRSFERCLFFANRLNFRAEPELPTNDTTLKIGRKGNRGFGVRET